MTITISRIKKNITNQTTTAKESHSNTPQQGQKDKIKKNSVSSVNSGELSIEDSALQAIIPFPQAGLPIQALMNVLSTVSFV